MVKKTGKILTYAATGGITVHFEETIMDKHAKELIILERIVKDQKSSAKLGLVIGIPLTLLSVLCFIPSLISDSDFIVALLFCVPLPALIIGLLFVNYYRIDNKIAKMRTALGVGTDEEFEGILEDCQRITDHVFISSRYLINFNTHTVTQLSDIRSCKRYKVTTDSCTTYGITIKAKGKKDNISFTREKARDEAYKIITTVADFAEDQKYIN